jgi:hypothetical protein
MCDKQTVLAHVAKENWSGHIVFSWVTAPEISKPLSLEPVSVPLQGKEDFAEVIKCWVLRWGDYNRLPRWAKCNHRHLSKREILLWTEEEEAMWSGRWQVKWCGFKSRKDSNHQQLWQQGSSSPLDTPEGPSATGTMISASETDSGLLASRAAGQ